MHGGNALARMRKQVCLLLAPSYQPSWYFLDLADGACVHARARKRERARGQVNTRKRPLARLCVCLLLCVGVGVNVWVLLRERFLLAPPHQSSLLFLELENGVCVCAHREREIKREREGGRQHASYLARSHPVALQRTATHCNTLQHPATHCNTLYHTASYCDIPHHTEPY